MGQEAACSVRFGDRLGQGKALLESDELLFRGEFRLKIAFGAVETVEAEDGRLSVTWPEGTAIFELGARAAKWAERIRNPRTLLDKLGVKAGQRVSVLGVEDEAFWQQLRRRVPEAIDGLQAGSSDLIFFQVEQPGDLAALDELRAQLVSNGGIWVISPKKRPEIADVMVMAAAREAGLVDTKVASFSKTHTALRLVIPRAQR